MARRRAPSRPPRALAGGRGRRSATAVLAREQAAVAAGIDLTGNNPSPTNIAAGLSTIEEKSLGNVAKSGHRPIEGLIGYGEAPPAPGCGRWTPRPTRRNPLTGFVAAGAQLVLFTTGVGNSYVSALAPTIKLSANPVACAGLGQQLDFDASAAFVGRQDLDEHGRGAAASALLDDRLRAGDLGGDPQGGRRGREPFRGRAVTDGARGRAAGQDADAIRLSPADNVATVLRADRGRRASAREVRRADHDRRRPRADPAVPQDRPGRDRGGVAGDQVRRPDRRGLDPDPGRVACPRPQHAERAGEGDGRRGSPERLRNDLRPDRDGFDWMTWDRKVALPPREFPARRARPRAASRPSRRTRFADQAYAHLFHKIVTGEFKEGEMLPSENELGAPFEISRPVVRQALQRLRSDGLIASRRGSGSFVQPRRPVDVSSADAAGKLRELLENLEFRTVIEPQAAFFAAAEAHRGRPRGDARRRERVRAGRGRRRPDRPPPRLQVSPRARDRDRKPPLRRGDPARSSTTSTTA